MGDINILSNLEHELLMITAGSIFLVTLTTAVLLTSFMCRLSWRLGTLDKPDGYLKCHGKATATLGGIPLILAMAIGLAVWLVPGFRLDRGIISWLEWDFWRTSLIVASVIILLLGVRDDIIQVKPRFKLFVQIIAALVLVGSGLVVHRCDFFGVCELSLGMFAVPFTVFWLAGSCNAFNFIDGMDGLASGIGVITAIVLSVLGFLLGHYPAALISLSLAGGLLGMLFFNVRPAAIFLGDSGSQLIGLLFGALTLKIATSNGVFYLPSAGLILSIPVLDAFLSTLRRYSMKESPAQGDHNHIHHCLLKRGLTVSSVAVTLWVAVLISAVMGIIFRFSIGLATALAAMTLVGLQLYVGVRLGCLNWGHLWLRISSPYRGINLPSAVKTRDRMAELDVLWDRMKPLFEQMRLDRAVLTLEGVNAEGQPNYQTYKWVRSENQIAELLASQWTKRFALDQDKSRFATIRLESVEKRWRDEQRIDWLLQQIRDNMRHVSHRQNDRTEKELEIAGSADKILR